MTLEERFWPKVNKFGPIPEATPELGPCWLWVAGKTRGGYGAFSIGRTMARAHRVSYLLEHGHVPQHLMVDHRCHNPACVRPSHLRLVTRKQNAENLAGANKGNISGVRGVDWSRRSSKWRARVQHDGKTIHLGHFDSIADAEAVVIAKRIELFTHNDRDRIGTNTSV